MLHPFVVRPARPPWQPVGRGHLSPSQGAPPGPSHATLGKPLSPCLRSLVRGMEMVEVEWASACEVK